MAINKKLLNFATKANFSTRLANSEIDDKSIVFIDDTGEIWTHGRYYGGIYGIANAQKVPLTIGGTSYNLSVDGHNHSLPATNEVTDDWALFGRRTYLNTLPEGLINAYNYGQLLSFCDINAKFQMYVSHRASEGEGIRYRSGWDVDKRGWATIWDSSNLISLNQITTRNFSDLQNKPTTLSGYGITDALFTEQVSVTQTDDTWVKGYIATRKNALVYNTSGVEWGYLFNFRNDGLYGSVLSTSYSNNTLKMLSISAGTWGSWVSFWHSGNSNLTSIPWSVSSLTMNGALSGATTGQFSNQITSTLANGTAPFVITSSTLVNNLNTQYLNGQLGSYYTGYADTAVSNIQIGGRNYLTGTKIPYLSVSNWDQAGWNGSLIIDSVNNGLLFTATNGWHSMRRAFPSLAGKTITISCNAKYINGAEVAFFIGTGYDTYYNIANGTSSTINSTYLTSITKTFTLDAQGNFVMTLLQLDESGLSTTVLLTDLKLEIGNKATDWTPAPEDVANRFYTGYDSGVANSMSCSNWFRSNGSTGWMNSTYGGGFYCDDTTWVKVYNNKGIYTAGNLLIGGTGNFNGSQLVLRGNSVESHSTNGVAELSINYYGYNAGYTQYRNLAVYNGKCGINTFFDGVNGRVGIGTNAPTDTLDVRGTGKFTGNITAPSFIGNADTSTTFSTNRTNYKNVTDGTVTGQLMWKNYGNNHTIFDASNSTTPSNTGCDNTNAAIAWSAYYPTLMGWNGSSTYGVRVDSARVADNADTLDGYHASSFIKTSGTITNNIDNDYGEGFVTFDPVPTGTPPISSPNIRTINIGNNFARRTQLAFNYESDRAYFRRNHDGTWNTWREFIHSGNIGSQSVGYASSAGNADTLDSLHAASFMRSDTDTATTGANLMVGSTSVANPTISIGSGSSTGTISLRFRSIGLEGWLEYVQNSGLLSFKNSSGGFINIQAKDLVLGGALSGVTTGSFSSHVKIGGGTVNLGGAWDGGIIAGADGHDKIVATYLASSTNAATIGAHNSGLTAWAKLNIAGTSIQFSINETPKMLLDSSGNLNVYGELTTTKNIYLNNSSENALYSNGSQISFIKYDSSWVSKSRLTLTDDGILFNTATTSNIVTIYDSGTTFNNVIQANSGISIADNYSISNGTSLLRFNGRFLKFNDGVTSTSTSYDANVITSRTYAQNFDVSTTYYNYIPIVLWHGTIGINSGGSVNISTYHYGQLSPTGTRLGQGSATINLNNRWSNFTSRSQYHVICTGVGKDGTDNNGSYGATPLNYKTTTSFRLYIFDDATTNDGKVEVTIMGYTYGSGKMGD